MNFPKTITIQACEAFLEKLLKAEDTVLELPVETKSFAFGGLASAIQAINTWVRCSERRALVLRASASDSQAPINEVIDRPHKFAAAMCAKTITSSIDQHQDLRQIIYDIAKQTIEAQRQSPHGQQRGGLCWFSFVDHSSKAFDAHFYIAHAGEQASPRNADQIESIIGKMINEATKVAGGSIPLTAEKSANLGRIFYELFLNTHEHGTRGISRSQWLRPGIRILYVNAINLDKTARRNMVDAQAPLEQYLANEPSTARTRYVEIGIVDSGLGYCDRWISDRKESGDSELSIDEEYSIFKQCFKFRQTSTSLSSKGNGLPAVMDNLTKLNGFIRIRSGRLALYRDFIQQPFAVDDACHFNNWTTQASAKDSLAMLSKVSGVAISIMVPLEAKQ